MDPVRRPRLTARESAAIAAIVAVALLVGELAIFRRADLTRPGSLVSSDAGYSLFVTSEVLGVARLYRDVAYPYGWLPVAAYAAVASCFGNTPTVYLQFLLLVSATGLTLAFLLTLTVPAYRTQSGRDSRRLVAGLCRAWFAPRRVSELVLHATRATAVDPGCAHLAATPRPESFTQRCPRRDRSCAPDDTIRPGRRPHHRACGDRHAPRATDVARRRQELAPVAVSDGRRRCNRRADSCLDCLCAVACC